MQHVHQHLQLPCLMGVRHVRAGRAMQARNAAVSEEASFSRASSHTAPGKRSSRKSVGGSALRVLSNVTQVHTLTDVYTHLNLVCMITTVRFGISHVCLCAAPDMLSTVLC